MWATYGAQSANEINAAFLSVAPYVNIKPKFYAISTVFTGSIFTNVGMDTLKWFYAFQKQVKRLVFIVKPQVE